MSKWKPCSVAGCLRRAKAHGICEAHLNRLRNTGSVKAELPLLMMNHKQAKGTLMQIMRRRKAKHGNRPQESEG